MNNGRTMSAIAFTCTSWIAERKLARLGDAA